MDYNSWLLKLTLNQPGSGKCVKYWGPFCFDLAFTRCKLTSPSICVVCHRALLFQKSAQNGAAPAIHTVRKRARAGPTENLPPPALYAACDRKLIVMLTGAAPHCRPRPGRTSPAISWSVYTVKLSGRGGSAICLRGPTSDKKNVKMDVKSSFFDVMSEVQKDLQDVSAGIRQFKKKSNIYEFCPEFDVKVSEVNFDLARLN